MEINSNNLSKDQLIEMGYYTDVINCVCAYYDTLDALTAWRTIVNDAKVAVYLEEYYSQIVYMYHIGGYGVDAVDELLGSCRRCQSMTVEQTCSKAVQRHIELVAYGDELRTAGFNAIASLAVGDVAFPAFGYGQLAYLLHDATCGGAGA